jgi:Domain of unknown function (DUF4194)
VNPEHPAATSESEHELLCEAIQRLLVHGAILREDHRDLYESCRVQRSNGKLDELARLVGLKLHWEHDHRLILAVPQSLGLLRRFRQDESLVALALWYDFDRAVKEDGKTPDDVQFKVRDFNESLGTKFKDLILPKPTRMREILQLFERKSLVRLTDTAGAGGFAETMIRVLPTVRFVIPFPDLEEWQRQRDRYVQAAESEELSDEPED